MGLIDAGIGLITGGPAGAIEGSFLPDPGSGGGGGGKKPAPPAPKVVDGKPLTTAAQFSLEQNGNRYQAPLYDPMQDPKTSAFLAPYLMYNPGRINGKDYSTTGTPQLGTYDPLGEGYYLSELQTRSEDALKKAKKKSKFGSIGATLGAVAGGVGGFLTGGPAGAIVGAQEGASMGQAAGNVVFDVTSGEPAAADIQAALGGKAGTTKDGASGLLSSLGLGGSKTVTGTSSGGGVSSTGTSGTIGTGSTIGGPDLGGAELLKNPSIREQDLPLGAPVVATQGKVVGDASRQAMTPSDTPQDIALRGSAEQEMLQQNPQLASWLGKSNNNPTWMLTDAAKVSSQRDLPSEAKKIDNMNPDAKRLINDAASRYGHSSAVLTSLAIQESSLNPNALVKDDTGVAVGLTQIRAPAYADVLGLPRGYKLNESDVKVLLNPKDNVDIGAKYLSSQFDKYGAQTTQEALAGYYGGPSMIKQYRKGSAPAAVNRYVDQVYNRATMIDERQRRKAISNDVATRIAQSAGYTPLDYGGS